MVSLQFCSYRAGEQCEVALILRLLQTDTEKKPGLLKAPKGHF